MNEIDANSNRPDGVYGVPTSFIEFDELTGGLHPGQMIVVAARPGVGKSTLALDIARSAAIHHDMTTVFFSLEMGRTGACNACAFGGGTHFDGPPQEGRS